MLGTAAQSIATAWFLLCGALASVPARLGVYDLVADLSDGLKRVQVKSTSRRDRSGSSWHIGIGHRPDGASTGADSLPYSASDVDLFFIVDGDLRLYLIPIGAVDGKASLVLRSYDEFVVGDASSLLLQRGAAAAAGQPPTAGPGHPPAA